MPTEAAAMVLDMLADTIDALNKGRSADAVVLDHLLRAIDADSAVSVYVGAEDTFEAVAVAPDATSARPLLAEVSAMGAEALRRHFSIRHVPHLGHIVVVLITPPEDGPSDGFGRILAFLRDDPFSEENQKVLERACRPLTVLWPRAAQAYASQRVNTTEFNITERELEVLELLSQGLLATSIASRLNLSPRTVHKHLGNIYRKLGVHDRLIAVGVARAHGLLPEGRSKGSSRR